MIPLNESPLLELSSTKNRRRFAISNKADKQVIDDHYTSLSKKYDDFLVYSEDFVRTLTTKMVEHLQLQPTDRFVDLGGGTGIYTKDILKQVSLQNAVKLVDPFQEMLDSAKGHPGIECLKLDAETFAALPGEYDKILIKEAIHHVVEKAELFRNLLARLVPGGILLLVHVPPQLDYPLFEKALEKSLTWHADPDELCSLLQEARFQIIRDEVDYPHKIPKEHYFSMVQNCYMSLLTSFESRELEAGLTEMKVKYADQETLKFNDHFDYLVAVKPSMIQK